MEKAKIQEYLKVLACPKCKEEIIYKIWNKKEGFYCKKCELFYPIEEDIPIMLIEEAISLSEKNESS
uniref:Trm112 family protein n=1 Tax=Thermodesulfobacterium geofontis TaxID=1295609 RepID=A0A7V6CE29_9BACT